MQESLILVFYLWEKRFLWKTLHRSNVKVVSFILHGSVRIRSVNGWNGSYELKNPAGTIIRKKVNISRLKVYTHREDCHGEESEKEGEIGIEGSGNENQRKGKGSERQLPDTDMDLKGKKRKLSTGDAVKKGKKRKVLSGNAEKVGMRVRCQLVI